FSGRTSPFRGRAQPASAWRESLDTKSSVDRLIAKNSTVLDSVVDRVRESISFPANARSARSARVDSRKSAIVAADVRRLTLKKTNGTEPPYVGCYGFLTRPWWSAAHDFSCYAHFNDSPQNRYVPRLPFSETQQFQTRNKR